MYSLVILIAVICVAFFTWTSRQYKKKKASKKRERPLFRTEENLEEYGKPMDPPTVDFEDEE